MTHKWVRVTLIGPGLTMTQVRDSQNGRGLQGLQKGLQKISQITNVLMQCRTYKLKINLKGEKERSKSN